MFTVSGSSAMSSRRTLMLFVAVVIGLVAVVLLFSFVNGIEDSTELECIGTTGVYTNANGTAAVANDPNCATGPG